MRDTQRSAIISTQLRQIAEQAIEHPDRVFTTLIHRMDVDFLREAYYRLRKDGAPGLSGVTAKDYGKELEANLADLHERLKTQRYVAPPIKRVWIDKDGGKQRPIGLLEIEDKIVQKAVSMLMGAVYEQDFHPFSYGFREERNAHQALGEIAERLLGNQTQDGRKESQEDGAGPLGLVSRPPAHGSGEAARDFVLKASGTLPVLWCALQHACDGIGTPSCKACVEVLAQSAKQQKGAELGEVRRPAG